MTFFLNSHRFGPGGPTDPYWADVRNLTTFDGSNGATTFPNLATNSPGPDFTANGTAALTTTRSRYGAASLAVSGTANFVRTVTDALYEIGSGSGTIEFDAYVTAAGGACYMHRYGTSVPTVAQSQLITYAPSGGNLWLEWGTVGCPTLSTGAYSISDNAWHNHCWVIDRVVPTPIARYFVDGVQIASSTTGYGTAITGNPLLQLGADSTGATLSMNVNNYRYTKYPRYTANYTPDAAQFPTS